MSRVPLLLVVLCVLFALHVTAQQQPYNTSMAATMLYMSGAAYCSSSSIQSWSCSFCTEVPTFKPYSVVYNSSTDMLSVVGYEPLTDSIVVAFRGTDLTSILNWLEDLSFTQVGAICDGCQVHEGFYNTYMSVRNSVVAVVHEIRAQYPNSNLVIAGHSLGGALTYLAALDFALNEQLFATHIVTFGQPRVGNDVFTDTYKSVFANATTWRVTHGADPVPHLPPQSFGFLHNPTEIFWDVFNTKYTTCDASGEDPTCADQYILPLDVSDHVTYLGLDFVAEWLKCKL